MVAWRLKSGAGAGPGRAGPLPCPGPGLCRRAGWGQWGRAARDAGSSWNANPDPSARRWGRDLRVAQCCLEHAGQYSGPGARRPGPPGSSPLSHRPSLGGGRGEQTAGNRRRAARAGPRERVAAIDVAKDSGMVCTRTPHPSRPGARRSTVWTVKARMNAVRRWAASCTRTASRSSRSRPGGGGGGGGASDYWRIWLRREAPCCIPGLAGRNLEDIPGSDGLLKIRKVKGTIAWCAARRFTVFPVQQGGTWRDVSGSDVLPGAERLREQQHDSQPVVVSRRMERRAGGPARYG